MKTILQALKDEISYPLSNGLIENKLIFRQLNGDDDFTFDVANSKEYKGALADCLYSLVEAPNISEANISVSIADREIILRRANSIYNSIGEPLQGQPMVIIGE